MTRRPVARIVEFEARDFRSLRHVKVKNLPQVVLLYGENDTGKSNFLQAVGTWMKLTYAFARVDAMDAGGGSGVALYEGFAPDWTAASDGSEANEELTVVLGERPLDLFRYGSAEFGLNATLEIAAPGEAPQSYQFEFCVSYRTLEIHGRDYYRYDCKVSTALWPSGRKTEQERPSQSEVERLRQALAGGWQHCSAERRLDAGEQLLVGGTVEPRRPIDATGSGLKRHLFEAAHGPSAKRRALFSRQIAPLITNGPFDLPGPHLILDPDDGHIDLLIGEHPVEHRGSGPQQWVLIAGMLAMSEASVGAIEEPEAHLSWEAQKRIAQALKAMVLDANRPPHQLFVSTHSILMNDMCPEDFVLIARIASGVTQVEREHEPALRARFPGHPDGTSISPLRLHSGELVRLTPELVEHLCAEPGTLLFATKESGRAVQLENRKRPDRSVTLIGEKGMGEYLSGEGGEEDGHSSK